jgi:hypothetical protein
MIITIKYGYRPGEKLVGKGNFICPLCSRKRQYKRIKIQKRIFFSALSFPSENIGEYIHCQSCLQPFPTKILDSGVQLKMKIEEGDLPPANIMEIWRDAYTTLNCEDLISNKTDVVETISPILFTIASHMQVVGVKLRLQEYEEARKYLITILNLGLRWQEINMREKSQLQKRTPKQHNKIIEYVEFSHVILSRLP